MRRQVLVSAAVLVLGLALPAGADQPPSADQYYARAIQTMRDLPQPNFATYDVQLGVTGSDFALTRRPNGEAQIALNLNSRHGESLVRSGSIQFVLRALGFGMRRVTMKFAYANVERPASLAPEMFPATR
jgi:hypothetical protein